MADVISLAPLRRLQAPTCPFPRQSAQILFFTGVRYERVPEPRAQEGNSVRAERRQASAKTMSRRKTRQPA